jgi:hypothetical protein
MSEPGYTHRMLKFLAVVKRPLLVLTAIGSVLLGIIAYDLSSMATATVTNKTGRAVMVYVAFGADSVVTSFPFCASTGRLGCRFPLGQGQTKALPIGQSYLNATLSIGGPVTCGSTKVELNLNNPAWYDIADVSLVDGFGAKVGVTAKDASGTRALGPVTTEQGNEKAFGVYPYGCDLCVRRGEPPCGIPAGREGCKTGPDQYHPDVPCQYQGTKKGGGSQVAVTWLE